MENAKQAWDQGRNPKESCCETRTSSRESVQLAVDEERREEQLAVDEERRAGR